MVIAKTFRMAQAEVIYKRPFWDMVRDLAGRGITKAHAAELMGYSRSGFYYLLAKRAPADLYWPGSRKGLNSGSRVFHEFERRHLRRESLRRARWITIRGRTRPVRYWERKAGLSSGQINRRIKRGWPTDRLDEPPKGRTWEIVE